MPWILWLECSGQPVSSTQLGITYQLTSHVQRTQPHPHVWSLRTRGSLTPMYVLYLHPFSPITAKQSHSSFNLGTFRVVRVRSRNGSGGPSVGCWVQDAQNQRNMTSSASSTSTRCTRSSTLIYFQTTSPTWAESRNAPRLNSPGEVNAN